MADEARIREIRDRFNKIQHIQYDVEFEDELAPGCLCLFCWEPTGNILVSDKTDAPLGMEALDFLKKAQEDVEYLLSLLTPTPATPSQKTI